jgi:hypothetical protein
MRSGTWSSRALTRRAVVGGAVMAGVLVSCAVFSGTAVGASSRDADESIADAGVLVAADLPPGFAASPDTGKGHADNLQLAKGVAGCAPYVALQKSVLHLPQAKSSRFDDGSRSMGNEVDVFPSEKAAVGALARYAKARVAACLEHLFEKQLRQDPSLQGKLADVAAALDRQDIAGLGDDRVVYEGQVELSGTDGSAETVGIGSAAVRVGRTVDVVTYTTDGADLTEVLTPAIDSSVGRLRAALVRETR